MPIGMLLMKGATTAGRDMGCSGWGFMRQLVNRGGNGDGFL